MTLVEVTVATAVFAVASLAAAHLLVWAIRALYATGAETIAVSAAQARMEELQSLAWRFDGSTNRISDDETDLAVTPSATGGPGLAPSPPNALLDNVDGYVDYLDERGAWTGDGITPPPSAAFVRRWAIRRLATAPDDTLVLQVLVVPLANGVRARGAAATGRGPGESLLTSARTRMR
jgi:type II secretory pathway pseudopilin PulG